ncbi:tetratricopeptide repeat protein [Geothrix sp. PMB-07]|uniref:tetratricopeptide repeat protein n=1 Tax=Geothrix sp. PMB-07 TaxID=3068640 RepID=UPI002742614D|nr:tetratricopeptide repeat protein [Geothrix sp. PMB-07]WLT33304.1 tetratricopeptide repeat protein [Geothrix sp. PMB-07]
MTDRCQGTGWIILLAALPLLAQHEATAPKTAESHSASKPLAGRMTDAQVAELAKQALGAENEASIKAALIKLKGHTFKSSKAPERELVLYVQGMLEARLGNLPAATVALKKLEKQWPTSPFMGEAQIILAEDAVGNRRFKEAEGRLHQALASDIPAELKRKPQELLIWTLVEQERPQDALSIVQSLRPLEGKAKPSEKGLAAMVEVLAVAGEKEQTQGALKDFRKLYPSSDLMPRAELAWGRLLGRSGDAKSAAETFRKLIKDHPESTQANDARLALANLLTDGSLPDAKGLPSAESLLAEVRKGGKGLPKGSAQVVELRLIVEKNLWEDALNQVERMDASLRELPEVKKLWAQAWNAWVGQRLEKGFPGELLARLKAGAFGQMDAKGRLGTVELLAERGLVEVLPRLLPEAPVAERAALRRAALAKAQPEAQSQAVLRLLPAKGDTPDEALQRARAEAVMEHWGPLRAALGRARPGEERIKAVLRLLQRPLEKPETPAQRLAEAEGWLVRAPEKGEVKEPLMILVADLRMQHGDARSALSLYPAKAAAPEQRGWVALMRAQAMLKLGQRDQAKNLIKESRDEQGFKGQRDALARSLGAY